MDLKNHLIKYQTYGEERYKKKFKNFYDELIRRTEYLPADSSFSQRKYIITHDMQQSDIYCPVCGKIRKFTLYPYMKYYQTCGNKECQKILCSKTNKTKWTQDYDYMFKKHVSPLIENNKNLTQKEKQIISKKISQKLRALTPEQEKNRIEKGFKTRKERGHYHKSKQEETIFIKLQECFGEVIRQYKSKEYPWHCDFYIPILDLYIEYQGMWTHGSLPYDESKQLCVEQLKTWKNKAITSKFYKAAIYCWTILDVKKRNTAKQNNLNYLEFFTIKDFYIWLDSINTFSL